MEEKEKEKDFNINVNKSWREWFKRDFTYIIVCLIALLICMISLLDVANYQEQCNSHWIDQWEQSGCTAEPLSFNMSYKEYDHVWDGGMNNGIKDID